MEQRNITVRKSSLSQEGRDDDLRGTTSEERILMMWQLTKDAWAFMGKPMGEFRIRRDIVCVIRGKR